MKLREQLIDTALGRREPDLVLKNAQVFNVFTGAFAVLDVAVTGGYIAGVGKYQGENMLDLTGAYLTPGFIDAHVHMESAMVSPAQFAAAVVPAGTTTVIADPHEIANVLGIEGVQYMLDATEGLPLHAYFMLPSCVPATELEHSGARLTADDLAVFMHHPRVLGLGEMMDYPGLLNKRTDILKKIENMSGKKIDGHAPGLTDKELTAYIAAGIHSDHECMTAAEATERLAQGMYVMLREGSAAKNLLALLPAVTYHTLPQCMFATDDRHPQDLIEQGHINYLVRLAVEHGTDVAWALKMATLHAARYFGVSEAGAVAPGYRADLLVFDNLKDWKPALVFSDGKLAARNGKAVFDSWSAADEKIKNTVRIAATNKECLTLPAAAAKARVIGLVPGQLVTTLLTLPVSVMNGEIIADSEQDIIKLAVWERHHGTGRVGVGLLRGLGLKDGAIASTIAHDSHNLIVAGTNDEDMLVAVRELERLQGGIAIASRNRILGALPLPVAGLMSEQDIFTVRDELQVLQHIARQLGIKEEHDPFMTLAFLSLPVIPAAKLTDLGLIDVTQGAVLSVSL